MPQGAPNTRKTHCPRGHAYNEENTYVDSYGGRQCRPCRKARMQERRADLPRVGRGFNNKSKTHCKYGHEYTDENTKIHKGRRSCRICAIANSQKQNIKRYGITVEQFQEMLEKQDNKCQICQKVFRSEVGAPHVDHDHQCCPEDKSCGKCVRGLLCTHCNVMLGSAKDNPEVLLRAVAYLRDKIKND